MLDSFLKVACSRAEKATEQSRLVEKLRQLPEETLFKIASGEEKLGYMGSVGCSPGMNGEQWLDRFKGTALFEQALELEKQDLQEQMAEQARYREEDSMRSARGAARDELSVQRKLLELQLAEQDAGLGGEPEAFAGEETPEEELLEHGPESPEAQAAAQAQLPQPPPQQPPAAPKEESPEKAAMKLAHAMMKMADAAGQEQPLDPEMEDRQRSRTMANRGALAGAALGAAPSAMGAMIPQQHLDEINRISQSMGGATATRGRMLRSAALPALEGASILGMGAGAGSKVEGAGAGALAGAGAGALPGAAFGAIRSTAAMPGSGWRGALLGAGIGAGSGALMGAGAGALASKRRMPEEQLPEQPVQPGMPEHKMAAAMKTAAGMSPLKARGVIGGDVRSSVNQHDVGPEDVEMADPEVREFLASRQNSLQGAATQALEHPIRNRMKGFIPGALAGGMAGAALGHNMGKHSPGRIQQLSTGIGGMAGALGIGGVGAALVPGAEKRQARADEYGQAIQSADIPREIARAASQRQTDQQRGHEMEVATAPRMNMNYDLNKMSMAMRKHAIGLGMLGKAFGGAAKSVGGGAAKAFQSARGFGASPMQATRMGAGAAMGQAPGALSTIGRAASSYAKSNPLQAAGIAGAAGLGAGYALG